MTIKDDDECVREAMVRNENKEIHAQKLERHSIVLLLIIFLLEKQIRGHMLINGLTLVN